MNEAHIAFMVESADGHVNPTLGIAQGLCEHRFRVSYAVSDRFERRVRSVGAEARLYKPLDYRDYVFSTAKDEDAKAGASNVNQLSWAEFVRLETEVACKQIRELYRSDPPNLIVYDLRCLAGRALAKEWRVMKLEHSPITIGGDDKKFLEHSYDEDLVLVSVPRFFQRNADRLDAKFSFVGPIFPRWTQVAPTAGERVILVSGPTVGIPTVERFAVAIDALKDLGYRVVLSIGDRIDANLLPSLPPNVKVSRSSDQLELLSSAVLFVSHAGQISTLEAMYRGVPILALPLPHPLYECIADRVVELGLGRCLRQSEVSVQRLRQLARAVLSDQTIQSHVKNTRKRMIECNDPNHAVRVIRDYFASNDVDRHSR